MIEELGVRGWAVQLRYDLLEAGLSPLELIRLGHAGGLPCADLLELSLDISEVTLEVLLHGAGFAVPFRTLVRRGRQTVVGPPKEVRAQ